jgi:hypothetical protein
MKIQPGYLTEESGAWIGHYSKWVLDPRTGEKKRRQLAFKIGALSALTIRWVGWWRSVGPRQPLKLGHIRHAKTQLREFIEIKHAI